MGFWFTLRTLAFHDSGARGFQPCGCLYISVNIDRFGYAYRDRSEPDEVTRCRIGCEVPDEMISSNQRSGFAHREGPSLSGGRMLSEYRVRFRASGRRYVLAVNTGGCIRRDCRDEDRVGREKFFVVANVVRDARGNRRLELRLYGTGEAHEHDSDEEGTHFRNLKI